MGWWGRNKARDRYAGVLSRAAWGGFFGSDIKGWSLGERYKAAGAAIQRLPGMGAKPPPIARALLKAPLGLGLSYFTWGSLIPAAVDLGLGMFQEAAAEGARLRRRTPETFTQGYDMSTRAHAMTMRQASQMAIHMSQLSLKSTLGSEASYLHA
jgi:hypothetical protein